MRQERKEWWGLQDQIKGICDRLALAGYDALAPDLYGGTVVPYHDTEAANREMSSLDFLEATDQLVRGAALHLGKSGPSLRSLDLSPHVLQDLLSICPGLVPPVPKLS